MVSASAAFAALTVAVVATSSSTGVDAHGVLSKPGPSFTGTSYGGNFHATVPMNALKPQAGDIFTNYPDANKNAAAFGRAFKASQYKTLKDFLLKNLDMSKGRSNMPKTKECGFTNPNGRAQTLPNQLEWYGGVQNHPGPCEVWCDNTVVIPFTTNCAATYPQGKFAYNKAACTGKKQLTFYWMSSLLEWQVYIQCIKLNSGNNGARSIEDSEDTEAAAAVVATADESNAYNATAFDGYADGASEQEAEDMAALAHTYDLGEDDNEDTELTGPSPAEIEEEAEVQDARDREAAEEANVEYAEETN